MIEFLCECYSKVRAEHFHKHLIGEVRRNYKIGVPHISFHLKKEIMFSQDIWRMDREN